MKSLFLFLNTLKFLKISQIIYRVKYFFFKPTLPKEAKAPEVKKIKNWKPHFINKVYVTDDNEVEFLNIKKKLKLPDDWSNLENSRLWLYNLHYFECLLNHESLRKAQYQKLLLDWTDHNTDALKTAWEPYPLSLRISNILKFWLNGGSLSSDIHNNIYLQASILYKKPEKHILGNHYLANLKAMIFAAIVYKNKKWLNESLSNLKIQLDEQINSDGGHFELSPMYHNIILVDLLDIFNLLDTQDDPTILDAKINLKRKILNMYAFSHHMSHQDKKISFFNDSCFGIALDINEIKTYLDILGLDSTQSSQSSIYLENSGYMISNLNNSKVIFDVGDVGARYQPGHGHADTLSFEMSHKGKRIIVNSGINTYDLSPEREFQRSTRAHNTVSVNDKNSSEVWHNFRVANRAKVKDCHFLKYPEYNSMSASHDGYKSFVSGNIHTRKIKHQKKCIEIIDEISGKFKSAKTYFYLHPDVDIFHYKDILRLSIFNQNIEVLVFGGHFEVLDSFWYPEFNKQIKNKVIEISYEEKQKAIFRFI